MKNDTPTVTTPDGEVLPIATGELLCPYEDCNWKLLFRITAVNQSVPIGKTHSRWLIRHIHEEHAPIYDALGLDTPDDPPETHA